VITRDAMLLSVSTTAWQLAAPVVQHASGGSTVRMSTAEQAAKAAWLARNQPAWSPPGGFVGSATSDFVHAPLSFFAFHELTPKGPRSAQGSLVDIGDPEDFTRPLAKDEEGKAVKWNNAGVGAWACTAGGWDSPKLRPTTEVFLVLDGKGSVTDVDGVLHSFGAGDVVVLPKHWSGRWDISRTIHKTWVVHDHPDVPGAADGVVRAVVASVTSLCHEELPVVEFALPTAPAHLSNIFYDVGPTRVGILSSSPGSFEVSQRSTAECFFVVDGVFFLTNPDGSARRCTAGDTVVLPKGWYGNLDVVRPSKQVWVEWGERA